MPRLGFADVDVRNLIFVSFGNMVNISAGSEHLKGQGLREAKARLGRFESRMFNCDFDAKRAMDEALCCHVD